MTRGENGETVSTLTVPVEVSIRAWDYDGETLYDWATDSGESSDELYDTIEEAATAARDYLGG